MKKVVPLKRQYLVQLLNNEVRRGGGQTIRGVMKKVVSLKRQNTWCNL